MNAKNYTLSETEAWRLFKLLEELNGFLHNPAHFSDPARIEEWLRSGVYDELRHAYYHVVGPWFPVNEETGEVEDPTKNSTS